MTRPLYLFVAIAIFALVMVLLALAGARNAREIAQLLEIVPHRPVTMTVMLLSLTPSTLAAACGAYLLVWSNGRLRNACVAGTALAFLLAALLYWSPQLVRALQGIAGA
jgi:hypothetical protein